ncbi:NUDIX hydrolase [Stackebrandtia soli]|uniref:NUDIX hydrolase n=1 Tax=Stackebrandtia soli TaxID=1892856 RepID=UPI0039E798BA
MESSRRVAALADQLRALAANGLRYTQSPYDRERYEKLMAIAAEALSIVDVRDAGELERIFLADIDMITPLVTADVAVFDDAGRVLLIQRSDCGEWCMPGGAADVGETPSEAAIRECVEETGLRIAVTDLIGIYDNRGVSEVMARHAYHNVFKGHVVGGEAVVTHESLDVGWFTEDEAVALTLFRGHKVKVPDAFAFHTGRRTSPIFH